MKNSSTLKAVIVTAVAALVMTGCSSSTEEQTNAGEPIGQDGCTSVVVATSSEKVNLMDELGESFKDSPEGKALDNCVTVYPINVASGNASKILASNPDEWEGLTEEFYPTVWSPASTVWTDRVAITAGENLVKGAESFTTTPVVFGVPESMAKALGYPGKDVGIKDIEALVADPTGWGSVGKPLWGSFKIAKTNPNTSTTGLSTILMQSYAASGKSADLTAADVTASADFSQTFESGAIHYGDTTGNVLSTLYDATQNGSEGSSYVSAIALEETSLINYNKGNPDSHTVQPGEQLTPPKEKLIAVYPTEGSMHSDNPAVVLGSKWVDEEERVAGEAFVKFLKTKPAQEILPKYGFRPIDTSVDASKTLNTDLGVDMARPTVNLPKPAVDVVSTALDQWSAIRKPSAVLELIDISGSMDEGIGDGRTRLEGAIDGAKSTLGNFRKTDEIGVWAFTTGMSSELGDNIASVRDFGPFNDDKENVGSSIDDLRNSKRNGTPLYDAISTSYDYMSERSEDGRINAIVVLSDGEDTDSDTSLESLLVKINSSAKEGSDSSPVRIFTIAYGEGADKDILERISKASGGQMFDASDPERIDEIFAQVINNF